jgi:acyl-CoA reductase-like NAD-dependent aldehyde dehydrogenase
MASEASLTFTSASSPPALVVLPGADVAKAASAGSFGSYLHKGQICMATGRHLVHESLYAEYLDVLGTKAAGLSVGDRPMATWRLDGSLTTGSCSASTLWWALRSTLEHAW